MRKSVRTGVATLLAGVAATAMLAGCAATPADPDAPTTLTVTTWTLAEAGQKDWWPAIVEDFESQHANVTVDVEQVPFNDYVTTLTTRLTAGQGPDVVHVPLPTTNLPAWAAGGLLKPLTDEVAATEVPDLWPATQQAMEWEGETYGILFLDYPFVLFYNEALLDAAGVAVPTTPEELIAAAKAATSGDKYGYGITGDNTINFIRDFLMFQTGEEASWAKPGEWQLTSPDVVAAADDFRETARSAPAGLDVGQKRQAFLDGNVAMIIDGAYFVSAMQNTAAPEVAGSLHAASVPFAAVPGDISSGFSLPAEVDPAKEDLAFEFMKLAASDKWQSDWAERTGSTVVRPGSSDVLASNPEAAVAVEDAEDKKPVVPLELSGLRTSFADFIALAAPALHQLIDTDRSTEEILADLQKQLEDAGITP